MDSRWLRVRRVDRHSIDRYAVPLEAWSAGSPDCTCRPCRAYSWRYWRSLGTSMEGVATISSRGSWQVASWGISLEEVVPRATPDIAGFGDLDSDIDRG